MRTFNFLLKRKLNDVFSLKPNEIGIFWLDNIYKKLTMYFKIMPFVIIIPLSISLTIVFYLVLGPLLIRFVSLLQYGF